MKRLIIICEGQTEQEFCKKVLEPHFTSRKIEIRTPSIKKSGGGIVKWEVLQRQIEIHLKDDRSVYVTTLIDYYGIHEKHQFPEWISAHQLHDKNKRMRMLEQGMKQSVHPEIHHRFIPYIQLHEFEGLLFNDIDVFLRIIPQEDFINSVELEKTIREYPNPEMINDTPNNAPSFRLKRLIKGYHKVIYGTMIAESIGLPRIRSKCPRFDEWIQTLEII